MSAISYSYLKYIRNFALVIAHFAVLGLQANHKYYRFSNLHRPGPGYHSGAIARTDAGPLPRHAENEETIRRQLLDRRFSYEHVFCLFSPGFHPTITDDGPELASKQPSGIATSNAQPRNSRGPPLRHGMSLRYIG